MFEPGKMYRFTEPAKKWQVGSFYRYRLIPQLKYQAIFLSNCRIQGIMAFVQPIYFWDSLDAKMEITITSILPYDGSLTTNDIE